MTTRIFNLLDTLTTESINTNTLNIDTKSALEIAHLINQEDKLVASAVERTIPNIALAIESVANTFQRGGRLIYAGAGTSGRLGILDASECPPTFGVPSSLVRGIIAGGKRAVFRSVEGAEDNKTDAQKQLKKLSLNSKDVLCGISASRRTPFVLSALDYAHRKHATTIFITSNETNQTNANIVIQTLVGPEVIAGSTRMKAGTSHKMVINMITTGAMILYGKTFGNLMIDLKPTNQKLAERTKRIFMHITNCSYDTATQCLLNSKGNLKTALAMVLGNLSYKDATSRLKKSKGLLRNVLNNY